MPFKVPAHTGGVDLRINITSRNEWFYRPRPHGRGGFKDEVYEDEASYCVPAHTGGVDLRYR